MERTSEDKSAKVPETAPQAEEDPQGGSYWGWAKRCVWTNAMLAALDKGVKGDKWFRLNDKVYRLENLQTAWEMVKANRGAAGTDRQSIEAFGQNAEAELANLNQQLANRTYRPKPVMRKWIPKPGSSELRPLGVPVVRDRTVQGAIRNVIEPIFEKEFAEHSYGFRPWRGAKQALGKVEELLKQGYTWVVDADIRGYFDNIPQDRLMDRVRERIADGRILEWIEMFLKAGVVEEAKGWEATETGTPQGGVLSPLLANIYLNPLDHLMIKQGIRMVRYADDFILLCRTEEEATKALDQVRQWMEENGLTLHPTKTQIVDATRPGGFDFLGYHFEQGKKWVRKKSMDKMKEAVREITRRGNGDSMESMKIRLNRKLTGWFAYFQESLPTSLATMDGFVRRRLRAVLLKRRGKAGIGDKEANRRWPNIYFEKLGLFSLVRAQAMKCQSP